MPTSTDLLDVNVWLALTLVDHPHHDRARAYWFEESSEEIAFCRITSLAFLRLCTQPRVTAGHPFTVAKAWLAYQALRDVPEVVFLDEAAGTDAFLQAWSQRPESTPRLWTDAYLASFAQAAGLRMVSFDRDFTRMDDLEVLHLENVPS